MANESETSLTQATPDDLPVATMHRRALLQSVSALTLAAAFSNVVFGSESSGDVAARRTRSLRIDQKFVLFPINNESLPRRVRIMKNGRVLRSFTASLGLPAQWWAHLDVSNWQGQTLSLSVEPDDTPASGGQQIPGRGASETDNAELAAAVYTSPAIWSAETLYKEPLRPAFHFTCRRGWTNDPNGLVYHDGHYHLFFQHNPYGVRWGNMHWGHAVSTDLVHWQELPIALYPNGEDDLPHSGSGLVDHDNTAGWAKNGRPPLVIAFTSSGRGECIAYSHDDGATWKEYEGNPVVKHQHDGRDPKLIWHPPTEQWVMVVYSERPAADAAAPARRGISFYTSANLKSWQERSWIEGYYECPDLFALPVDGDPARLKWVLTCGPGHYSIGEFDGARFLPDSPRLPAPTGGVSNDEAWTGIPLFYAAQTFSNHPEGHRVQISWARVKPANAPFTMMMTFPTTLSLRTTAEGVRLCRQPVDTIRSLRTHTYDIPAGLLSPTPLLTELDGEAWDIEAVIRVGTIVPVLLTIGGDEYEYHVASQMLHGPTGSTAIPITDGKLTLRILVDRTTVEIFGDRGQAYGIFVRSKPGAKAPLELRKRKLKLDGTYIDKLRVHSLRSAWTV